jgi:hypothetical protein
MTANDGSKAADEFVCREENDVTVVGDANKVGKSLLHADRPYEVPLNLKQVAVTRWHSDVGSVEIIKMRGNFWKSFGYCIGAKNFLYPEEALLLLERGLIVVEDESNIRIALGMIYEEITSRTGLPCYLTYVKLRVCMFLLLISNRNRG